MKRTKINILDIYNIEVNTFTTACHNGGYEDDCLEYLTSRVQSFDEDIAAKIWSDIIIEELILTNSAVSIIYFKELVTQKSDIHLLSYKKSINYTLNFCLSKIKKECGNSRNCHMGLILRNALQLYTPMELFSYFTNIGVLLDYDKFRIAYEMVCNNDIEDNMCKGCQLFTNMIESIGKNIDINEKIKGYIKDPILQASYMSSSEKKNLKQIIETFITNITHYAYVEWFKNNYPDKFKLVVDYCDSTGLLNFDKVDFPEFNIICYYHNVGDLTECFFEWVLSKNIESDTENAILQFFAEKCVSNDIKEIYEQYRQSHQNAREIEFLEDIEPRIYYYFNRLPMWGKVQLKALLKGLQKPNKINTGGVSFVSQNTSVEDFLYSFGFTEYLSENYSGINWTGNHNNVEGSGKTQIIDLLLLMGFNIDDLKSKKRGGLIGLESVFNQKFASRNFYKFTNSKAHSQLEKIVKEALA